MKNQSFKIQSEFQPAGDQPEAIAKLTKGIQDKKRAQTLLGVTGSGKTYTMAKVIEQVQKPTLVMAHNKTLAAQLYQELRDFFPNNAVSYFVSYYDYYQPEAYIASTDTYIEKDATINDEIDKLRLSATSNLLTRPDVIVVASVSCIYNLGSPVEYGRYIVEMIEGQLIDRQDFLIRLQSLQYDASPMELRRGSYRQRGDIIQVWPANEDFYLQIDTLENKIISIAQADPITGNYLDNHFNQNNAGHRRYMLYPAKHYLVDAKNQSDAMDEIRRDLEIRLKDLRLQNKVIEAYRLEQKVNYDLEQIKEFGFCNGIENYSRYFDGREIGQAPYTLLEYFKVNAKEFNTDGFLTIMDESHMSLPQISGMYFGDHSRKQNLIQYGFRLPSALDNRPLKFDEFLERNDQFVFVSATPAPLELNMSEGEVVEQLVRPTGLVDPEVEIRPTEGQVEDLIREVVKRKELGQRVLVTVLTKKMAESLTDYLNDEVRLRELVGAEAILPKVAYLHSDVDTLERSDILHDLREGKYDVLVGINLLREGLDLPEVSLVAILDADKEGFLRSETSLVQTIGRAARHLEGRAILYADRITGSMQRALDETKRRREFQIQFNKDHGIVPTSINKAIREKLLNSEQEPEENSEFAMPAKKTGKKSKPVLIKLSKDEMINLREIDAENYTPYDRKRLASKLRRRMKIAANDMDFELAAMIRDQVKKLED
ncbi:MAG: excinuclease ABC subunit UvrB [Pseudomonadales bacterium]|jgi:excinuclease ABC subunit B|nr:excinuclease ABC subunit UvrB [Pseudomonadales bacterium]